MVATQLAAPVCAHTHLEPFTAHMSAVLLLNGERSHLMKNVHVDEHSCLFFSD